MPFLFKFPKCVFLCRTFCSVHVVSAFSPPSSVLCPLWPAVSTYSLWTLCTWWVPTQHILHQTGFFSYKWQVPGSKLLCCIQVIDTQNVTFACCITLMSFPSSLPSWLHIALVQSTQNAPLLRTPSWPTSWTLRSSSHPSLHPPTILLSTPAALKQTLRGTTQALNNKYCYTLTSLVYSL